MTERLEKIKVMYMDGKEKVYAGSFLVHARGTISGTSTNADDLRKEVEQGLSLLITESPSSNRITDIIPLKNVREIQPIYAE